MNVTIIGSGYVGIVTGVCLAELGHKVVCVDVDERRVDSIRSGQSPIYEKGLDELLRKHLGVRLSASRDLREAILGSEVSLICVGSPSGSDGANLTYIREASQAIGQTLRETSHYHAVVVKSTVPPGTTDDVVLPILEETSGKKAGVDFGVGMNPEFLTEGEAIHDFMEPDRIVIGGLDNRTRDTVDRLYRGFEGVVRLRTNNRTAELIKYASNALLATLISFSNEFANLCSAVGDVDIADVLKGVHSSRYLTVPGGRDGSLTAPIASFLWAGCGFGGSCLPKDVQALIAHGKRFGSPMRLLEAVQAINERQPHLVVEELAKHFSSLRDVTVAVLGLSFRPDTDDMRESPAIPIIEDLLARGARVTAFDPAAGQRARQMFSGEIIQVCDSLEEAVLEARAIVLVTSWKDLHSLPERVAGREPAPLVFDCRRMLDPASVVAYDGIGFSRSTSVGHAMRSAG